MLKSLKKYQIQITPFIATKDWQLSNATNNDLYLFESTGSNDGLPYALEYIDYSNNTPITSSVCDIALEKQELDLVNFRDGLKLSGIFYPDVDPKNNDGTYKRVIYSQIVQTFYNGYRNPTKMWGMENIDFDKSQTLKFVSDKFKLFDIPQLVFGEKILEYTVKLFDRTTDNDYIIQDDGHCNLFAGFNIFSHQQELGDYKNEFVEGDNSDCGYYWEPIYPTTTTTTTTTLPPTLIIITNNLPAMCYSHSYDTFVVAQYGNLPYTWSVSGGSLPPYMHFNTSSGEISGTYMTLNQTDVFYPITISVKDTDIGFGYQQASHSYVITSSFCGIWENYEIYSIGSDVNKLNGPYGFNGIWITGSNYINFHTSPVIITSESFEAYTVGDNVNGLNGPYGWSASWTVI